MGIPTLIKTLTAADDASLEFVDGTDDVVLDGTYDEYMFVFTDINPADDNVDFTFQANASGQSGYNETMTTTFFESYQNEAGDGYAVNYTTDRDQAQATGYQPLGDSLGNGGDESLSGILHLFSPASTTYVKHFYSRVHHYHRSDMSMSEFAAGYFNFTAALTDISFKMSSGNMDGVIQMYGVA